MVSGLLVIFPVAYIHVYVDDSRNSDVGNNSNSSTGGSNELKDYKKFIVGGCVGIFILILLICAIVCIRSK